ncbi:MAG: KH domain-containing protein [Verrucomicrobiota bacterium]|nr:KH domain-containing protein [Limisphaera sp.]MDW8383034.1 KH domain-containing protein [Verrucomicrobiota bacterium]
MREFLEFVIKGLVSRPETVNIREVRRSGMLVYQVSVDEADMGKVIGKNGVTINAIRSLVQVGGARRGQRCAVEVNEAGGGRR